MEKIQSKLLEYGYIKSLVILSLAAIIVSGIMTYASITLIWGDATEYDEFIVPATALGILIPTLIAPLVFSVILKLLFRVRDLELETRELATYDALTGLLSRRAFYENAEQQLQVTARNNGEMAIMVADLDGFKAVNDTFGHAVGDETLKFVGDIIARNSRASDLAGRVGGDEFVFCLPNTSRDEAEQFSQRLLEEIQQAELKHGNKKVEFGTSIGLHISNPDKDSLLSDFIHQADVALYQAKKDGKGRVHISS